VEGPCAEKAVAVLKERAVAREEGAGKASAHPGAEEGASDVAAEVPAVGRAHLAVGVCARTGGVAVGFELVPLFAAAEAGVVTRAVEGTVVVAAAGAAGSAPA